MGYIFQIVCFSRNTFVVNIPKLNKFKIKPTPCVQPFMVKKVILYGFSSFQNKVRSDIQNIIGAGFGYLTLGGYGFGTIINFNFYNRIY